MPVSEGLARGSRYRIIGPVSPIHRWRACRRHTFIGGGVTVSSGNLRDIHSLGRSRVIASLAGGRPLRYSSEVIWLRRIAAVLALFVVLPGAGEALENVVHLVAQGHSAHAGGTSDRHQPPSREHGCTGAFHLCHCCPSASAVLSSVGNIQQVQTARIAAPCAFAEPVSFTLSTLERPPRT